MEKDQIPVPEYIEAEYKKLEQIGWIDTPIDVIKNARETFIFNCLLADAIGHKLISPSTFRREIPIHTGGPGVTVRKDLTDRDLLGARWNNVVMALGTAALATDKALDATFGPKNPGDTSDLGSARAIIYQIRNAFAHDPFNPQWIVKGKYQRCYRVTLQGIQVDAQKVSVTIEVDFTNINNRGFKPQDIGGLEGFILLLEFCLGKVEADPHGRRKYVPPVNG